MTLLATRSLSLAIPGRTASSALTFGISAGECWGVLGPNGVGKSTLLHTLAGLRSPLQGSVEFEQRRLSQWPRKALARRLGVVFQHPPSSIESTVFDSAAAGLYPWLSHWQRTRHENHQRVHQALAELALTPLASQRVASLSGGERQRLEIATLMVQAPDLWLVDEPTNHLDLHHQQAIMHLLARQAAHGKALVMALHDINLAIRWCSHLLLLFHDGSHCWGSCDEMANKALLEKLYQQPLVETSVQGYPIFVPSQQLAGIDD